MDRVNIKPLTVSEYLYLLIKIVYKYKKLNILINYELRETYTFLKVSDVNNLNEYFHI